MSMKNSSDTIGNRTRDLLACSAVPQPTAPPRIPGSQEVDLKNVVQNRDKWKDVKKSNEIWECHRMRGVSCGAEPLLCYLLKRVSAPCTWLQWQCSILLLSCFCRCSLEQNSGVRYMKGEFFNTDWSCKSYTLHPLWLRSSNLRMFECGNAKSLTTLFHWSHHRKVLKPVGWQGDWVKCKCTYAWQQVFNILTSSQKKTKECQ